MAYRGFQVHIFVRAAEEATSRLQAALDLIAEVDPRSLTRARRDMTGGIAIGVQNSSPAWYDLEKSVCFISATHIDSDSVEQIALSIIHEACHARIDTAGIAYDEPLRNRIELACLRRERRFALRLEARDPDLDLSPIIDRNIVLNASADYSDAFFTRKRRLDQLKRLRSLRRSEIQCLRRLAVVTMRRRRLRARRPR